MVLLPRRSFSSTSAVRHHRQHGARVGGLLRCQHRWAVMCCQAVHPALEEAGSLDAWFAFCSPSCSTATHVKCRRLRTWKVSVPRQHAAFQTTMIRLYHVLCRIHMLLDAFGWGTCSLKIPSEAVQGPAVRESCDGPIQLVASPPTHKECRRRLSYPEALQADWDRRADLPNYPRLFTFWVSVSKPRDQFKLRLCMSCSLFFQKE